MELSSGTVRRHYNQINEFVHFSFLLIFLMMNTQRLLQVRKVHEKNNTHIGLIIIIIDKSIERSKLLSDSLLSVFFKIKKTILIDAFYNFKISIATRNSLSLFNELFSLLPF